MARAEIAQFDEVSLYAFGLDRVTVQTLRNIVRIVGTATQGATVPEVAEQVGETAVLAESTAADVVIVQALVDALEADRLDVAAPDNAIARRLADIEAALEHANLATGNLMRALSELQADHERTTVEHQQLTRRVAELETEAS